MAFINTADAQSCTGIGQTPSTAFPVCGTKTFYQQSVPYCGDRVIPGPACNNPDDGVHIDMNPYWYKFTCYTAGTLGFKITPNEITDDYDWQIFDITNTSPNDVFTNRNLFLCMNWSGEGGVTGASSAGTAANVCGGQGQPTFSSMPTLIKGHRYLLMISHFSKDSQSGYNLEFGGGTADITDPVIPNFVSTSYNCGSMTVSVKLSKRLLCNTLAADGSDFAFTTPGPQITGATGVGCSDGFDMDSVILQLNAPLSTGDYTIITQSGSDGNTLLNPCGNALPVGQTASFHIDPPPVVLLRTTVVAGCAPNIIKIGLSNPIRCESIAADGSDFSISGTSPISIVSATGNCNVNNLADTVILQLNKAIQTEGDYSIVLMSGTDGNAIVGECHQPVATGQVVSFHTVDTVSADFSYTLDKNCKIYIFTLNHDGAHKVNSWKWSFDDGEKSSLQNLTKIYDNSFGDKQIQLVVSNGVCSDTVAKNVYLEQTLGAMFDVDPGPYCPLDIVIAQNKSFGSIVSWFWDYGNGNTTSSPDASPQQYFPVRKEQDFLIRLIVTDNINCRDTADHHIMAVTSCYIDVPTAFSPNKDGMNDYLYPLNAYKAIDLNFAVYNRVGQLVFETTDWTKKWDGTVKGNPADIGTYVWMLHYTRKDTGKKVFRKGTTVLVR
ncbi:gliding motility-associated C-terminal domain-containing protein [Chitinophaga sp. CF118]|uniref:T9SS type B sorting domain-containing protein n=1 Tax=Chitinophaga sp. CF118 TaxID=1884367 RepID=UPI0015A5F413|nr:gliding motility-associated C-terminal domain-containing protein [Chitinophaga sp. CF118]